MALPPRLKQTLTLTAVILAVLVLAGATYQGVATALERRRHPHPGGLYDVGGHQLHLHCSGDGAPAVILEAPASAFSAAWGWIQPELAETTRTCSYDRAGLGWSEAGDAPFDPARVPEELHALLRAARVEPPYVLAGHSLGGAFARLYAARYPDQVAALVLIDATHPAAVSAGRDDPERDAWMMRLAPWAARTGLLRLTGAFTSAAAGLPEPQRGAAMSFLNRPDHLTRAAAEFEAMDETLRLLRGAGTPGTGPVLVLPAAERVPGAPYASMLTDREPALVIAKRIAGLVARLREPDAAQ